MEPTGTSSSAAAECGVPSIAVESLKAQKSHPRFHLHWAHLSLARDIQLTFSLSTTNKLRGAAAGKREGEEGMVPKNRKNRGRRRSSSSRSYCICASNCRRGEAGGCRRETIFPRENVALNAAAGLAGLAAEAGWALGTGRGELLYRSHGTVLGSAAAAATGYSGYSRTRRSLGFHVGENFSLIRLLQ